MKDIIIDLIGEYSPLLDENDQIIQGLSGIDFTWIVSAICFMIPTFLVLKCISSLLIAAFKGGN